MKVLYITHYAGFYGANRSLLKLICELRELHDVEPLVIIPMHGTVVKELVKNKIPYKIYKFYNWQDINSTWFKAAIKHFLNCCQFPLIALNLRKNHFDIIHTNTSICNLGGYLSKKMNRPHIWHIREFGKPDFNAEYFQGIVKAGKFFTRNATVVIAISKAIKEYYKDYINPDKIEVIYNGVEVEPDLVKKNNENRPLQLCFTGVITENKNQMEAILACLYLLKEKKESNFMLNFIGDGPDDYYPSLVDFVEKNGLSNHVKFFGYVNNIDNLLKGFDLGIVCSKREAFGRVTVEYMARKIPVIASNSGANPEIIKNGVTGYLYSPGNHEELANYIYEVINERSILEDMGSAAYKDTIGRFLSTTNTSNIIELYNRVCNK